MAGSGKPKDIIDEEGTRADMKSSDNMRKSSVIRRIKLYIVEEQELLQEAYKAAFQAEPTIEVVGISSDTNVELVVKILEAVQPDVVILGTKMLQPSSITQIEAVREQFPERLRRRGER